MERSEGSRRFGIEAAGLQVAVHLCDKCGADDCKYNPECGAYCKIQFSTIVALAQVLPSP
jgi:hypothetical protein